MKRIGTLGLVCALLACAQAAEAAVEQGAAKHTPWSGYWWPIARGESNPACSNAAATATR